MADLTTQLLVQARMGDKKARDTLVEDNLGLVHYIVKRFLNRGYEAEDLFQIGCIGLMKAIDQFDISYQVKFSTYAVPLITGEIKRFIRDDGLIKISRSLKENSYHIMKASEKFMQEYNRQPSMHELVEVTGLSDEEIVMAMEINTPVESIYQTVYQADGNEIYLIDQISQNGYVNSLVCSKDDTEKEKLIDHIVLNELMDGLDENEKRLIQWRFYEEKTQTEIAKLLNVNQVQICRMEKKIVRKMREKIEGKN